MRRLHTAASIAIFALTVVGAFAAGDGMVVVSPARTNEILLNPGKGWVLYGKAEYKTPEVLAIGSIGYTRFDWAAVEPEEGQYDWSLIDNHIKGWADRGKQSAFGVMTANSHSQREYVTPKWVFDAGAEGRRINRATPDMPNGEQVVPVWDDPIFVEKLRNFLTALAARYDGNPFLEWFDIKAYGNWGQQNLAVIGGVPLTDEQLRDRIIMHQELFHKTQLAFSWGDSRHREVYSWVIDQGIWLRDDGITGNSNGVDTAACMGKGPAIFELFDYYPQEKSSGWWDGIRDWNGWGFTLAECVLNGKPSYIGFQGGQDYMDAARPLIRDLANRMGYHFVLRQARHSRVIRNGEPVALEMTWENLGLAPMYLPCHVAVTVVDENGIRRQPLWLDDVRPGTWMPNVIAREQTSFTFTRLTPGTYRLAIGLFRDKADGAPTYRIGNEGRTDTGWYALGEVTVAEPGAAAPETAEAPEAPPLDLSVDLTVPEGFGWTPLHWAAMWNRLREVEALLAAGAPVDARDDRGKTALHWAATPEVARVLVEHGADLEARCDDGRVPLHLAVAGGRTEVARYLLDCGAEVDARSSRRETPLHLAAYWEQPASVQRLLDRGADPVALDQREYTPMRWAIYTKAAKSIALLEKYQ